ncbi:hypothetical protein BB560_001872 [Smittium megazygosporum]|uniref:tRNA-dihydrouridine synthase n=1 Tax=Smittium megazygosporum TaxID=133381 RepID=A0A2T9ZGC4_9FUNG|nr:hypothetical protein BB560_001872 [Smittium megazygosporum]
MFRGSSQLLKATVVAPMVDVTTVPFLHLLNLISPHENHTLYTEMFHANCFLHNELQINSENFFKRLPVTNLAWGKNLVVQIGTCSPHEAEIATSRLIEAGANEINLNVGCPSGNVQSGNFGCVLMKEPDLVAQICKSMVEAAKDPNKISVKCRIGIDNVESFGFLSNFVSTVFEKSNVTNFVIHARSAWLKGLSPKQNRQVPKLNYPLALQIKERYPELNVVINGGIASIEEIKGHLESMDGVMIGRKIMNNPWFLQDIDQEIYKCSNLPTQQEVFTKYLEYADFMQNKYDFRQSILAHPLLHFFSGAKARAFRGNITSLISTAKKESQHNLPLLSTLAKEAIDMALRQKGISLH